MFSASEKAERRARVLAELTELGLSLARGLHADAQGAETPEQRERAAKAFHLISRSVRQSLALDEKLDRMAVEAAREVEVQARVSAREARETRQEAVRHAVERLVWTEVEAEGKDEWDAEATLQRLDDLLLDETIHDTPLPATLEEHVAKMCRALGLKVPGEAADAPPPEPAVPEPPA